MSGNIHNNIIRFINGAIDDLYQKITQTIKNVPTGGSSLINNKLFTCTSNITHCMCRGCSWLVSDQSQLYIVGEEEREGQTGNECKVHKEGGGGGGGGRGSDVLPPK